MAADFGFYGTEALEGGLQGASGGAALGSKILPGKGTAIGAGVGALLGVGVSLYNAPSKARAAQRNDRLSRLNLAGSERAERLGAMEEAKFMEAEKERKRREKQLKQFYSGVGSRVLARLGGG